MKYQEKIQENLLLAKIKSCDPEAFNEVYNLYFDRIYRFVYFKVSSREEAEDITSEVFLKAWQYLFGTQKEVKSLKALLYRIARNLVVDFYRKRSRVEVLNDENILEKIEDYRQQNLLEKIDNKTEILNIEIAIKKLKDEYREVIILRHVEGLDIKEIAKIMDKSRGAVRTSLHRALKILREYLNLDEDEKSRADQKN